MIYGLEEPGLFPVKDLYDSGLIQSYIGDMRRDYERQLAEQKDFIKTYSDFMSPIPGASEAYQNESIGKVMNVYNNLLQNGIDPLRSMEGRMALRNAMNSIDYNKLAIMRESAKIREEYDTAVKQAKLAGKYNDELEKIALEQEGIDLSQPWDNNKLWTRRSPEYYTSFTDTWQPIMKSVPKTSKTTKDPITGLMQHQEGVFAENLKPIIDINYNKWASTPSGQLFLRDLKNNIRVRNPYATEADINKKTEAAAKDAIMKLGLSSNNPEVDRAQLELEKQARDFAHENEIMEMKNSDNGTSGNAKNNNQSNLFRIADKNDETFADYRIYDTKHHRIEPIVRGVRYQDSEGKIPPRYTMSSQEANKVIFTNESIDKHKSKKNKKEYYPLRNIHVKTDTRCQFTPNGQLCSRIMNGKRRYFISGTLLYQNGNSWKNVGGSKSCLMEVREGETNYGITVRNRK